MITISPKDLATHLSNLTDSSTAPHLLDVRTPGEFESAHIEGSKLHPSDQFDTDTVSSAFAKDEEIILICQKGPRAIASGKKLEEAGFTNLTLLEGGVSAWKSAKLPAIEGKGAIGMDRQMRIVAGLLCLTGMALGTWVAPGWYGLSTFVGAGLVFAGITDCCPMTSLLALMPWNRSKGTSAASLLAPASTECCSSST